MGPGCALAVSALRPHPGSTAVVPILPMGKLRHAGSAQLVMTELASEVFLCQAGWVGCEGPVGQVPREFWGDSQVGAAASGARQCQRPLLPSLFEVPGLSDIREGEEQGLGAPVQLDGQPA